MSSRVLTGGRYQIVYADPPWQYRDKANAGKRGAVHKYNVMGLDAIKALQVERIAAEDCLLAMWWVAPMPAEALAVVEAWGFTVKTMKGFTWHKLTKHGKSHFGMGNWTRANTEDCLIATRGKPKRQSAAVRQFVEARHRGHSVKPDEVRNGLVELMGDVPRIELFARSYTSGWDVWGDQIESDVDLYLCHQGEP